MGGFKHSRLFRLYDERMENSAFVLAIVAGLIHVYIFYLESIVWRQPRGHRTFGVKDAAEVELLTPVMFNQGFYNLFLAIGAFVGAGLGLSGSSTGEVLTVYVMAFIAGAAIVLVGSRPSMIRSALIQGLLPAVSVILLVLS